MAYLTDEIRARPRAKTKPTTTRIIIDVKPAPRPTRDALPKRPAARPAPKAQPQRKHVFDARAYGKDQRERIEAVAARARAFWGR